MADRPRSPDQTRASRRGTESGHEHESTYDAETIAEDAITYFTDPDDEGGSPVSETEAPPTA